MRGCHSTKSGKRLLGLAEVAVALVNHHPLADHFRARVGRMTREPSASSFSATGRHQATPRPSGQLLHDLEAWNFDIGGETDAAAEKKSSALRR
jgi:hypothetical protein